MINEESAVVFIQQLESVAVLDCILAESCLSAEPGAQDPQMNDYFSCVKE